MKPEHATVDQHQLDVSSISNIKFSVPAKDRGLSESVSKQGKPGKPVTPGPADYNHGLTSLDGSLKVMY